MDQRRKYKRLAIPVSLRMRLMGKAKQGQGIKATSRDVSFKGFLLETEVFLEDDILFLQKGEEPVKLDPFLVGGDTVLEFNIKLPPDAKIITAKGKITRYQVGSRGASYYFKAGISLEKMTVEDGKRWITFIRDMALD
jgi:c-di-GMP-binding flagellar brake protein YcgR